MQRNRQSLDQVKMGIKPLFREKIKSRLLYLALLNCYLGQELKLHSSPVILYSQSHSFTNRA